MHEVLVNRLGGLSLPRKSVVRLTDGPDMTLDVYCGRKTTIQSTNQPTNYTDKSLFQERLLQKVRICSDMEQTLTFRFQRYLPAYGANSLPLDLAF